MKVSYDRDHRKMAVEKGYRLFTFQITGPKGRGGITVQGPYTPRTIDEIKGYIECAFKYDNESDGE